MLTVQQAAEILGVAASAVYNALNDGRLPYEEVFGRKVIKRQDAEAYKARTQSEGKRADRPKGSKNQPKVEDAAS